MYIRHSEIAGGYRSGDMEGNSIAAGNSVKKKARTDGPVGVELFRPLFAATKLALSVFPF